MTTTALTFYSTSIGKKAVMAVTGFLLFLFVLGHLVGNLQVYAGAEKLNAYAELLRRYPALLWAVRAALLGTVLLHMIAGTQLKLQSLRSRGGRYQRFTPVESTISSRWMIWTGLLLALFVGYHLLHLTFGTALPGFREGEVYHNFVTGFHDWRASLAYLFGMLFLFLHLRHGLWSLFQSLGVSAPGLVRWRRAFATTFAILIFAGNVSMPAAVLLGWVR